MNIKQIESANRTVTEIQMLDRQIIDLEKAAMLVAEKEVTVNYSLNIHDEEKKRSENKKAMFDEDGSLVRRNRLTWDVPSIFATGGLIGCRSSETPKEQYTTTLSEQMNEFEALQILGVLLQIKQEKRIALVERLKKIGVEI